MKSFAWYLSKNQLLVKIKCLDKKITIQKSFMNTNNIINIMSDTIIIAYKTKI